MPTSYLPARDVDRVPWFLNFSSKLKTTYGAAVGFSTAELGLIEQEANTFRDYVQYRDQLSVVESALVATIRSMRSSSRMEAYSAVPALGAVPVIATGVLTGIFNRVTVYVNRIKGHPNYTDAMGQALGIIAPVNAFDPANMKPKLTVTLSASYPLLKWKRGQADGIYLYVDRRDGNGYVLIDKLVRTEYLDTAALPQGTYSVTWDYKARYMIDDDEIGLESLPVSINVIRV